jgi:hypothetical protein
MKLETEERSVAELREHRKVRLHSIFDVRIGILRYLVMGSGLFELPLQGRKRLGV